MIRANSPTTGRNERSETRAGDGRRGFRPSVRSAFLLIGASGYVPAMLYAGRSAELSRGYRLGLLGLAVGLMLLVLAWLLSKLGLGASAALEAVSIGWLVVGLTGRHNVEPQPIYVLWLLLAVGAACTVPFVRRIPLGGSALAIVTFVLIASPIAQMSFSLLARSEPTVLVTASAAGSSVEAPGPTPDIWFVVLDGYPSIETIESLYGGNGRDFVEQLELAGFSVNSSALSPYSMTNLAIPSILDGRYVVEEGPELTDLDAAAIRRIIGGENTLVQFASDRGYHVWMVENGWHFSECGPAIDQCISGPGLDEQVMLALEQYSWGSVLGISHDDAFARGAQHTKEWIGRSATSISGNGRPDFVFAHLLAPHPPLRWRSDCGRTRDEWIRSALNLADQATPEPIVSRRRKLFVDQLYCVQKTMLDLVEDVSPDTLIVLVGDHGGDSLGQVTLPATSWSREMIEERMLTFAAVRLPAGCDGSVRSTIEIASRFVGCLDGVSMTGPELRSFISAPPDERGAPSVSELSPIAVSNLVG